MVLFLSKGLYHLYGQSIILAMYWRPKDHCKSANYLKQDQGYPNNGYLQAQNMEQLIYVVCVSIRIEATSIKMIRQYIKLDCIIFNDH